MHTLRTHGSPPYSTAVIHGGPGAAGDMKPVAEILSLSRGVLEPMQTAFSIDGQVLELHAVLQEKSEFPVTLIGHSWGAWLSFIFAAGHAGLVKKLILVGSGPFEEQYVPLMQETRLSRLSEADRKLTAALTESLGDSGFNNKQDALMKLGATLAKADSYEPISPYNSTIEVQPDIFIAVMEEARKLRKSGSLLSLGRRIECPVVAIHGDYDPHLFRGVAEPLSRVLNDFRMILLEKCGHYPWKERHARDAFFSSLAGELQ